MFEVYELRYGIPYDVRTFFKLERAQQWVENNRKTGRKVWVAGIEKQSE